MNRVNESSVTVGIAGLVFTENSPGNFNKRAHSEDHMLYKRSTTFSDVQLNIPRGITPTHVLFKQFLRKCKISSPALTVIPLNSACAALYLRIFITPTSSTFWTQRLNNAKVTGVIVMRQDVASGKKKKTSSSQFVSNNALYKSILFIKSLYDIMLTTVLMTE